MVKGSRPNLTEISREMTINVAKSTFKIQPKKKAPRCVREIRRMVAKVFKTEDVRIDTKLNKLIWSRGIQRLPRRIRVRVSRKLDTNSEKGNTYYSLVEGLFALKKNNRDLFSGRLTEKAKSA
jgi:large subunit ribosomal protein L31e